MLSPLHCLASQDDDTLPRLGLLACACSDGTIRIFPIPHPEHVHDMIRKQLDKNDFVSVCRVTLTAAFVCLKANAFASAFLLDSEAEDWELQPASGL